MPHTFRYLPVSIPEIFEDIVNTINQNFLDDDIYYTLYENGPIQYRCETWMELIGRLEADSRHPDYRNTRYPLIALIRNFDEKIKSDSSLTSVSLNLIIVCRSEKTMKSELREQNNYIPILRPIYSELMECIKTSNYFNNYMDTMPTHTKTESFMLGTEGNKGNTNYALPDVVDGIIITNLELDVVPNRDSLPIYLQTATLSYLHNITEIGVEGVDTSFLITRLVSVNYINLIIPSETPTYRVYYPHNGTSRNITVGGSVSTDISTADNGEYIGSIITTAYAGSIVQFYYKIAGGKVKKISLLSKLQLTNFVLNSIGPNGYTFDVIFRNTIHTNMIKQVSLTSMSGNVLNDYLYAPPTTDTTETTFNTAVFPSATDGITQIVDIDNHQLTNSAYFVITNN